MKPIQHSTRWLGRTLARGIQYLNPCPYRRSTLRHALAAIILSWLVVPSLVLAQNLPPVADAGPDQSTIVDVMIGLHGTATDPNGNPIFAWLWSVESAPDGSTPYVFYKTLPDAGFRADVAGDYVLSLIASDGFLWSEPDYVTIQVYELLPPVAVATADVTSGPAPLTVHFDGSQSYDPQGGDLVYMWNFGDGTPRSGEVSPAHTYSLAGTYTATLSVANSYNLADFDTVEITVTPGGNIQVSPQAYDFGDVELGSASSTLITIVNSDLPGGDPLYISDISLAGGSSADFAITADPAGSTVLPGESVDVAIAFTPTAEGYAAATLEIASDDPVSPLIQVPLGGVGVSVEPPPEEQVAAVLAFMDAAVETGSLAGDGPGGSAANRLSALENMIEASGDLIAAGAYDEACAQLGAALKKCDGQPSPPDFVTGEAASALQLMIEELRSALGCE